MKFPCSHCGSDESFADRKTNDFKAIVPVDLQGDFEEPPEFISDPSTPFTSLSTESSTKPVSKPPVPKPSSDASPKSDVKSGFLEGPSKVPPQVPTSSTNSPMKGAHEISRVVAGMVTKSEETEYRTFLKNRLSDIETTIQSIQTDIQSLIEGQKNIERMLKER